MSSPPGSDPIAPSVPGAVSPSLCDVSSFLQLSNEAALSWDFPAIHIAPSSADALMDSIDAIEPQPPEEHSRPSLPQLKNEPMAMVPASDASFSPLSSAPCSGGPLHTKQQQRKRNLHEISSPGHDTVDEYEPHPDQSSELEDEYEEPSKRLRLKSRRKPQPPQQHLQLGNQAAASASDAQELPDTPERGLTADTPQRSTGFTRPAVVQQVEQAAIHDDVPFEHRVEMLDLQYDTSPEQVMESWTDYEKVFVRRRLVQFVPVLRKNNPTSLHISTRVLAPRAAGDRDGGPSSIHTTSCIYWEDEDDYFLTSVDLILMLESLFGRPFTIEEKNRIRRNAETYRPTTITGANSPAFFRTVMGFRDPMPRRIAKDLKVFLWKNLADLTRKIMWKLFIRHAFDEYQAPPDGGDHGSAPAAVHSDPLSDLSSPTTLLAGAMSASTTLGARSAVSSDHANGTPLSLMFPLSSFLSSPILHDRQYRRDWQMHTSPSLGTVSGQLPASAGGSAHHQLHSPRARALGANHPDGRNPTSPTNNQRLPPPWPGVASELPWPRSAHPNEQPMSSQLLQFESDPPFLNWPLAPDVDGVDFDHLGVHDSLVRSSGGGSVGMGPELLDPPFLTDAGRSQTGTDTTGDSQLAIMSDSAMFGLGSDDTAAAVAAAPTSQGADTHDDSGFLTTTMMMSPPISGTGGMFSVPGGTHAEAPMLGGVSLWSVEDGLTGSPESRVDCVPAPTVLCVPTPPPAPSNGERWTEIELSFTPLLDISTVMDAMRERDVVGWAATTPFLPTPLASPHPHQLTTAAPHHLMARHFNGPAAHQAQSADDGGENGGFLPQGQVDGATHEDDPELHWLTSRSESLLRENTSAIFDTVAEIAAQTPIDTQLLGAFCAPGP